MEKQQKIKNAKKQFQSDYKTICDKTNLTKSNLLCTFEIVISCVTRFIINKACCSSKFSDTWELSNILFIIDKMNARLWPESCKIKSD